ncbi:MAG: tRNA lysidine(34) synthetase TilS [Hyphomonadaceae bacterium]
MLDRLTIGRMMAWTGEKPVLLALSGGGDSVALLHLLAEEIGPARVRAVVVDHALREGSAADAVRARDFAEAQGVGAEVLTLAWSSSANRAQAAAREARYRAICAYARAARLNTLVAAHTADDQAETVLMRAAKGSAWRGLAGIAPFAFAPIWPEGRGIALARPLLGARRGDLRSYLRGRGADWIEDPANANAAYERVRVRERLRELEALGLDPMQLAGVASRLRARADALDVAAAELIHRSVQPGLVTHVSLAAWRAPRDVRLRALSVLIAAASGSSREPPWGDLEALEQRVMDANHRGSTYGGVAFSPMEGGLALAREPGAVLGRADGAPPLPELVLTKNVEAVWDGRLSVVAPEEGWRLVPARNAELAGFENDIAHKRYGEARDNFRLQPLAAERITHALAPDINRAKP